MPAPHMREQGKNRACLAATANSMVDSMVDPMANPMANPMDRIMQGRGR